MNGLRSVFVLLLVVSAVFARIHILSGIANGTEITSAEFYKRGDDFSSFFDPINGILVDATAIDVREKIVYLAAVPKSQFYTRIFELKERGVIGVISGSVYPIPGQDFCTWTGEDMTQIRFPIAAVFADDFTEIHNELLSGAQIYIQMTSEGNPWTDAVISVASIVVFRVILGGFALSAAIYGSYKLIMFIKRQGSHFNVPQVSLGLEIIANLWRVLSFVVDPLGCGFVFGSAVNSFMDTVSLPYALATFVLITFYWHEIVTDASIMIYPFLSKLRIPFFVITFVIIALDVTLSLLGFYLDFSTTTPMAVIYLVLNAGFLIFYVVTFARIMGRMKVSKELRGNERKFRRLSKVNTKMILNAVARFCLIITNLAYIFPAVNRHPVPSMVVWAIIYFVLIVDSYMRLILFDVPREKSSASSSKRISANETRLSERTGSTTGGTTVI